MSDLLTQLRDQVHRMEGSRRVTRVATVSSGCRDLDERLPLGGFCAGTLVEWLTGTRGGGAGTLALLAAREAMAADGGALVVLDRSNRFYPPAAAAWGINLDRTILLRCQSAQEELWAAEQALRCTSISALWAPLLEIGWKSFRRLQLAAEQGGGIGFLLRPAMARGQPSWSDIQLQVEPLPQRETDSCDTGSCDTGICNTGRARRLRLQLTRCRSGRTGQGLDVVLDEERQTVRRCSVDQDLTMAEPTLETTASRGHETHLKHLAAQLAHPKVARRTARA